MEAGLGDLGEGLARAGEDRVSSGKFLPTANGGVDVKWIQLHSIAASAHALGSDDRRTRSEKGIQNNIPAAGAVAHRVGNQRYRLHRWVNGKVVEAAGAKRVDAGVGPHVTSIPPVPAELDIVSVRRRAIFVHKYQLVLRAIERTLSTICFVPHNDVDKFVVGCVAGRKELA